MKLNLLSNALDFVLRKAENPSVILIGLSAFGWFTSMVAQMAAIKTNKNIEPEKKKFLLAQERNEGISNIATFLAVTTSAKNGAEYLIDSGKIMTPATQKVVDGFINKSGMYGGFDEFMGKVKPYRTISNFFDKSKFHDPKFAQDCFEKMVSTKRAYGVVATLVASVVACNIITPIFKNKMAAKAMKKEEANHPSKVFEKKPHLVLTPPVYNSPVFSPITKI